jgi:fructose-bisphosphate aldolase class II
LHGGSGIPSPQIKKAISLGVCKFNVGTEFLIAFTNELVKYFKNGKQKGKHGYDPRNYFPLGLMQVKKVAKEKIKFLGSAGKANK